MKSEQIDNIVKQIKDSNREESNRLYGPAIKIESDQQAIELWLAQLPTAQTRRRYSFAATKLMRWKKKPLGDLSIFDMADYLSEVLRSLKSAYNEMAILSSMFEFLRGERYLQGNPALKLKRRVRAEAPKVHKKYKYIDAVSWSKLVEHIEYSGCKDKERRLFLVNFLYKMGPRVHEVAESRMNSFVEVGPGKWWWFTVGKGGVKASVPLCGDMVSSLSRYRSSLGLKPLPSRHDSSPLIRSVKDGSGVTAQSISLIVVGVFREVAEKWGDPRSEILAEATAHWMRHSAITNFTRMGDPESARILARHSFLNTTMGYMHADSDSVHATMSAISHQHNEILKALSGDDAKSRALSIKQRAKRLAGFSVHESSVI